MIILGIETSCDETALALIETRGEGSRTECRVIDSLVHSQAELHSAYGGVYPTLAKREHGKNLVPLLYKLLADKPLGDPVRKINKNDFTEAVSLFKQDLHGQNDELIESLSGADFLIDVPRIDRIAVTEGPGLEPALWVGINFAKFISKLWNIPLHPINHMEGHIVGSLLDENTPRNTWQNLKKLEFPALALLISGGHTEIIKIKNIGEYEIIGQTRDDAVGEAFDKVARLLGLPYPGGPHISLYAKQAREENIKSNITLPRPMINSDDCDFSFSGLKTSVLYLLKDMNEKSEEFKKGLAREFEDSVSDTLDYKLRKALDITGAKTVIIGGGVIANETLRQRFKETADEYGIPLYLPSRQTSGDNALMIALAGTFGKSSNIPDPQANGTKRLDR